MHNGKRFINLALSLFVLAVFIVAVHELSHADERTVAPLAGAAISTLVMWPCGFVIGWIVFAKPRISIQSSTQTTRKLRSDEIEVIDVDGT